ncbi:type II CAAX endopeptidase family protein [Leuconostocaceae bacterium ESL0958]|nr:type II CAAX endopeptidase family protein [Leuconostocaceae bacterium ESL0958]
MKKEAQKGRLRGALIAVMTFLVSGLAFLAYWAWEYLANVFIQGSILVTGTQRIGLLVIGLALAYVFIRTGFRTVKGSKLHFHLWPKSWISWSEIGFLFASYAMGWVGLLLWNLLENTVFARWTDGSTANQEALDALFNRANVYSWVLLSLVVVILAPLMEELLFRGLFFHYFASRKAPWLTVILSAFLFGAYHLGGNLTWRSLLDIPSYMILGLVMAFVYQKTGRLRSSVLVHMFHNGWIQLVSLLALFH